MNQGLKVLVLLLLLGVLGFVSYKTFIEKPEVAAAAPGDDLDHCPNGTVECPNNCLKKSDEGWVHKSVKGHPDTDLWMAYTNAKGETTAYNQKHIGHVIEPVNGEYKDTGVCPCVQGEVVRL